MKEYEYFLDTNIFLRPIVQDKMTQAEECGQGNRMKNTLKNKDLNILEGM
jgi:hypothetical protein